jgi:hypothetical protein
MKALASLSEAKPRREAMLTKVLGTTAALAMLTTASFAQTATQTTPQVQDTQPAQTSTLFTYPPELAPKVAPGQGLTPVTGKVLASGVIGQPVYESAAADATRIGEINDIVIGENGVAQAAVIGVGGFLGVGEKDVAVGFDHLNLATQSDGDRWFVADVSKDDLNNAPAFDRSSDAYTGGVVKQDRARDSATGATGGPNTTGSIAQ